MTHPTDMGHAAPVTKVGALAAALWGGAAALGAGGAGAAGAGAGGALGGGAAAEGGSGAYTLAEGMPALGNGVEGGAFDMYGSQASPTDASTVFDPSATMKQSPSSNFKNPNMQGGGQSHGNNGPRPHDYLAYLQGQPQQPTMAPPMGQGTFWGQQQQPNAMTSGIFGLGGQRG